MQLRVTSIVAVSPICLSKAPSILREFHLLIYCTVRVPTLTEGVTTFVLPLPGVSKMLVKAPLILRELHFLVSPMYLPKYQHVWGSHAILAARFSPIVLSKYQHFWGSHCWVSPMYLPKYQHVWGSYACLLACFQVSSTWGCFTFLLSLFPSTYFLRSCTCLLRLFPSTSTFSLIVLSKYHLLRESLLGVSGYAVKASTSDWGSYTCLLACFQVSSTWGCFTFLLSLFPSTFAWGSFTCLLFPSNTAWGKFSPVFLAWFQVSSARGSFTCLLSNLSALSCVFLSQFSIKTVQVLRACK